MEWGRIVCDRIAAGFKMKVFYSKFYSLVGRDWCHQMCYGVLFKMEERVQIDENLNYLINV